MKYEFFLPDHLIPLGFKYPQAYKQLVSSPLPDWDPWYIIDEHLITIYNGLQKRYPARKVVPFARRQDNDDIACFDASTISDNPSVIIIHDWASPGWENRGEFKDFLEWVELAKLESKDWKEIYAGFNE